MEQRVLSALLCAAVLAAPLAGSAHIEKDRMEHRFAMRFFDKSARRPAMMPLAIALNNGKQGGPEIKPPEPPVKPEPRPNPLEDKFKNNEEKPASPREIVTNHIKAGIKWGALGGLVTGSLWGAGVLLKGFKPSHVLFLQKGSEVFSSRLVPTALHKTGTVLKASGILLGNIGVGVGLGLIAGAVIGALVVGSQLFPENR